MSKVTNFILAVLLSVGIGLLVGFILINWILGCETWDQELWTETNSCVTIQQLWEGGTNP
jgi:hypothetical protein